MTPAFSANAKIATEAALIAPGQALCFVCAGNGKFLRTFDSNNSAIHALGDSLDQHCLFTFVAAPDRTVKLYSLYHRSFVSAIGAGWPLFPRVEDETWSRFQLVFNPDWTINLRSAQPIAQGAYVSVIGEQRIVRIAEATPRAPWSYLIPYSVNQHLTEMRSLIEASQPA